MGIASRVSPHGCHCLSYSTVLVDPHYFSIHSGPEAPKFLQSLICSDVEKLLATCAYTAFFTPKGRVLSEAHVVPLGRDHNDFLLDCPKASHSKLLKHLKRFKLRAKVHISDVSEEWRVVAVGMGLHSGNMDRCKVESFASNVEHGAAVSSHEQQIATAAGLHGHEGGRASTGMVVLGDDKRHPAFGKRAWVNVDASYYQSKESEISLQERTTGPSKRDCSIIEEVCKTAQPTSHAEYNLLQTILGVCPGSDLEGRLPLECNLDLLGAVDFDKGCYLGQELTARTKFRGQVRKRILPCVMVPQSWLEPIGVRSISPPLLSQMMLPACVTTKEDGNANSEHPRGKVEKVIRNILHTGIDDSKGEGFEDLFDGATLASSTDGKTIAKIVGNGAGTYLETGAYTCLASWKMDFVFAMDGDLRFLQEEVDSVQMVVPEHGYRGEGDISSLFAFPVVPDWLHDRL